MLRGKCSACKAPISPRYPAIELFSALMSAALVWHFGSGWMGMATVVFGWFLLAMTMIDYDTQLLPDDLTYPLLWAGLLINLDGTFVPLHDAVIGAAVGYLALWSIYWLFKLATGLPPMAYLSRFRVETAAALLLHTDAPVTQIGNSVGWPDQNYFARRFKAHYGLAASTYRARFSHTVVHMDRNGVRH